VGWEQPEVPASLGFYWQAFSDCHPRRIMGGAIPQTEIEAWLRRKGVESLEERTRVFSLVDAMDRVYLKHASDQQEKARREAKSRGRTSRRVTPGRR
jgi:hypothetical protein